MSDINLGGDRAGTLISSGSTNLLNGQSGDGDWTLSISETFDDGGPANDGFFGSGSFFRVNFVPAPSSMALLGLGGLAAARRRR